MSEAMVDMDGTYHVWKTKSLPCYMQQVSEYFKHDRSQMDPCDALSLVHQTLTCTAIARWSNVDSCKHCQFSSTDILSSRFDTIPACDRQNRHRTKKAPRWRNVALVKNKFAFSIVNSAVNILLPVFAVERRAAAQCCGAVAAGSQTGARRSIYPVRAVER